MELTQLRYFMEAANTGNLSKAAKNLHISQPSISKAVSKLEEELGTRLFTRNGRSVELNDDGRAFLARIAPSVAELQEAARWFSFPGEAAENRITVGVWGECDALWDCMRDFALENPGTFFTVINHIEEITRPDIRDYDLLLYPDGEEYFQKFRGEEILRDEYLLAAHGSETVSDGASVSLSDLGSFPFVSPGADSAEERILARHGVLPARVACAASLIARKELVRTGLGACLVACSESRVFAQDPEVRLLKIRDAELFRVMKICFKRGSLLGRSGTAFLEFAYAWFGLSAG